MLAAARPPLPCLRLGEVGKYWKFNCVVCNFGNWLPFQGETLRRFVYIVVHVDEDLGYGVFFRTAAVPCAVPCPLQPPAPARRFLETQLSVSHPSGESGAAGPPGFGRVPLALLVFD